MRVALGRIEARQLALAGVEGVGANAFQVFAQWGEDGIIQYLLRHVPIERRVFVEFGVEDYREANTRFLLLNNNWEGVVLDGSEANIAAIQDDAAVSIMRGLQADAAFVTRDTINEVLTRHGITGDIGLLSIDIDGNDYWVWEAMTAISPRIVVIEYNSLFGDNRAVTIPYDPAFVQVAAHYSSKYFGASARALALLGARKGYTLVGGTGEGVNLFFVRRDVVGNLPAVTPDDVYVRAAFRDSRGPDGRSTRLPFDEARALIGHLPLLDIETGETITVAET